MMKVFLIILVCFLVISCNEETKPLIVIGKNVENIVTLRKYSNEDWCLFQDRECYEGKHFKSLRKVITNYYPDMEIYSIESFGFMHDLVLVSKENG